MKKNIFLVLLVFCFIFSVSAKNWTNYAGIGLNVPFAQLSTDKDDNFDNISELGFGAEMQYIGVHSSGFSLKASLAFGCMTSDDIEVQWKSRNVGIYENMALGFGYSFIHSETVLLGCCAVGGVELSYYSDTWNKDDKSGLNHRLDDSVSIVSMSVGADLFGVYNFSRNTGFFASLGSRYVAFGSAGHEYRDEWISGKITNGKTTKSSTDIMGKFIILPTFGVMWHF